MKTINYGIIGCGSMGREHIASIEALGHAKVTAIADPHAPSREAACALLAHAPPKSFEHYHDLLGSGVCDALVVATPNFTHIEVMRAIVKTSLPVLLEKPVVTTLEDGLELVQLVSRRKPIVWVGLEYRYIPPIAEMVRMVHGGAVGSVRLMTVREHREPFYPKIANWNRFTLNTGGTFVEKCCHYFNLMELVLQKTPIRVFASASKTVNHQDELWEGRTPDILDNGYAILEYEGGVRAMLELCMFAEGSLDNECITVVGDEGKIESFLPSSLVRYGRRADWGERRLWGEDSGTGAGVSSRRIWDPAIRYHGFHYGASFIAHGKFTHAIREGLPAEISVAEGLRSVITGLAVQRSIETGQPVELSFSPDFA